MANLSYVMTVSRNGQVSIPAAVRARWADDDSFLPGKVLVVDMGGYLVIRPALKDPIGAMRGKYAGRGGPSTDEMRRQEREDDAGREDRWLAARAQARAAAQSA